MSTRVSDKALLRFQDVHKAFGARKVLQGLDLESLRTDGFGFQIEVTANLLAQGVAVHEMPVRFVDRTVGESKMSSKIFLEAMLKVWEVRRTVRAKR